MSFFPQLIAGPIVHHSEMMPQFKDKNNQFLNYRNIALGLFIFSIGLFKKVVIADNIAHFADFGFDKAASLSFIQAWMASLSYSFQLYFDFSGYCDMAIGIALFFNIKLPINFNSPYKALNIQDFWRRWHITLSRFLKEYLYIPLGGNRVKESIVYRNLILVFLIGGFWHGAGWTFIIWGLLHGIALSVHRAYSHAARKFHFTMPKILAWLITFNFINLAWVFFRAKDLNSALKVLKGMVGGYGFALPHFLQGKWAYLTHFHVKFERFVNDGVLLGPTLVFNTTVLFLAILISLLTPNSINYTEKYTPKLHYGFYSAFCFSACLLFSSSIEQEFIYFNF